jgi:outer membrane biosynthesis protein TonB
MHLDFEDYRPDTPRVPSAISRREGVLLSLIAHLIFVIAIILLPKTSFFQSAPVRPTQPLYRPVQFVAIEPLRDRRAPPRKPAVMSDIDRRSATRVPALKPENDMPVSRGNTTEKLEGAPAARAAGPTSPTPDPPSASSSSTPPNVASKVTPELLIPPRPAGGSLGDSLRNLQRYLQDQNFDNQKGGLTEQAPDIQFDSKGADFGPWIRRFRAQVEHNWLPFIPQAGESLHGHVVLQLNIHRDGTITELHLVQGCQVESFNTVAFNALKLSNPTIPLPAEYPSDVVLFTVTFFYNERIRH